MPDPRDRVAIVSGAASGIGFEIARTLAQQGARIAICDINDPVDAVDALRAAGAEAIGVTLDIADEHAVALAKTSILAAFGRIDILVNNAALFAAITRGRFDELDVAEWRRVLDVNVTGPFLLSRAVWEPMRRTGGGRIVNITSASIYSAPPTMVHYVTSKGALTAMTRSMARAMGPDNITVNAVAPGFTLSSGVLEQRHDMLETVASQARAARAIKRDQTPQDIVGTVSFLCSDESAFITGQTIVVDGGAVMR